MSTEPVPGDGFKEAYEFETHIANIMFGIGPTRGRSEQYVRDLITSLQAERDEMALRWSNCAMRNAITLREIQLLAADGLETGCVEGDDEFTLFTSIHRLSCQGQGSDDAPPERGSATAQPEKDS